MKNSISPKKLFMMLSTETFAMTSLMLPAILVGYAGKNGLPVLLGASGLLLLLAVFYLSCLNRKNKSIDRIVEEELNGAGKMLVKTIYLIRYFLHSLFLMLIFVNLIREVLLPGWKLLWILLPMLLLVFMTAGKNLRVRGRILEVLFPCVFLPLLLVLAIALFRLDFSSLPGQLWHGQGMGYKSILYSVYGILLFYQPVEFSLFLVPALNDSACLPACNRDNTGKYTCGKGRKTRVVGAACMFAILVNILMYICTVGMFGTVRTGKKLWSALYIMQSVRLPGKFLERLDILFLVFWVFSIFALFSAYLYYAGRFVVCETDEKFRTDRLKENKNESNRALKIYAAIWLLLILVLTLVIGKSERYFPYFVRYKMWIDFPVSVLLSFFLYKKKEQKSKDRKFFKGILPLLFCFLFLTGCQTRTDIEDKNYVMAIAVEKGEEKTFKITYEIADLSSVNQDGQGRKSRLVAYEADSLKEAEEMDKVREEKRLDYGHLKVMLLSQKLFDDGQKGETFLDEVEKSTTIAGTVLVIYTEEAIEQMLALGGEMAASFGEYMESLISHQKGVSKEDTLAGLLRDRLERKEQRTAQFVKIEKEQLVLYSEEMKLRSYWEKRLPMFSSEAGSLSDQILRFHIRADSDSVEDQQTKNAIKDRILPDLQMLLSSCTSKEECLTQLEESIPAIEKLVADACTEENYSCEAKAYTCREYFPLRQYGNLILPCGMYDALRIDLGRGEGANWWCMMYPSLCFVEGVIKEVPEDEVDAGESDIGGTQEDETHRDDMQEDEKTETAEKGIFFEKDGKKFRIKWKFMELLSDVWAKKAR